MSLTVLSSAGFGRLKLFAGISLALWQWCRKATGILMMIRILSNILVTLLVTGTATLSAGSDKPPAEFSDKHQAGIRLGAWTNMGDLPPDIFDAGSAWFFSDINSGSFHFEGYVAYRLSSRICAELAIGLVNRGDVRLQYELAGDTSVFFGNLNIYPIVAKVKLYPVRKLLGRFHPYLTLGGGLYWARHDLFAAGINSSNIGFVQEESAVAAGAVVGGGFDWPVASVIGLEFNTDYMPITFSDGLLGSSKWSGLTITFGVKYLFESDDMKDNRSRKNR